MATSSPSVAVRSDARAPRARATRPAAPGMAGAKPSPLNRRPMRRWITAAILFVAALLVVAYVANVIAVNDLVAGIASLQKERDAVRADNERLRSELVRLMSVERVTALAGSRLGLVQPSMPPVALGTVPNALTQHRGGRGDNEKR